MSGTKAIAKLKDDARKHEQKEEWEKAIQAYLQVLKLGEQGDGAEVDLPLYNRVGDLYVRLGRPMDAVKYYEQAADRYAEAGLYNNAIALCNKAMRYDSSRLELLRKLGSFSASQGFFTDARRYYLEYAETSIKRGALDEAFAALSDYADVNDEPDVRELLARQLAANGRKERALEEFKRSYAGYTSAGQQAQADKVRAEIVALDPSTDLAGAAAQKYGSAEEYSDQLPGYAEDDVVKAPPSAAPETMEIESSALAGSEEAAADRGNDFGSITLEGFSGADATEQVTPLDIGLEHPMGVTPEEVAEEEEYLPTFDLPGFGDDPVAAPSATEDVDLDLPGLPTFEDFDAQGSSDDLPLIQEEGGFELPTFEAAETAADLGLETPDFGDVAPLDIGELERDEIGLAGEPLPIEALESLPSFQLDTPIIDEETVTDLPTFEVETIEESFGELPTFELEEPEPAPLPELEPETEPEAMPEPEPVAAAPEPEPELHAPPPAPAPPPPRVPAPPAKETGGYVDLAALLGEDEDQAEDSTRFVVAEKPPTGDEEQDFADMLAQFRQKVAESIPQEDAGSHYDLGIAFKEMGLIDEAIGEFQTALRAGHHKLHVYEELGSCFIMKQQYSVAITILNRAQQMPHEDDSDLLGVFYNLGRAHEELGQRAEAKEAYEKIVAIDIGFQDTTQRLARL